MPMLFYGTVEGRKRGLYAANYRSIEVSIFDGFKIGDLAPYGSLDHPSAYAVANHWWFERRKHTAIAWHYKELGTEQVVFLPGLLNWMVALELARVEFGDLIPSPIIFRFNNYEGAYLYE